MFSSRVLSLGLIGLLPIITDLFALFAYLNMLTGRKIDVDTIRDQVKEDSDVDVSSEEDVSAI